MYPIHNQIYSYDRRGIRYHGGYNKIFYYLYGTVRIIGMAGVVYTSQFNSLFDVWGNGLKRQKNPSNCDGGNANSGIVCNEFRRFWDKALVVLQRNADRFRRCNCISECSSIILLYRTDVSTSLGGNSAQAQEMIKGHIVVTMKGGDNNG